MNRCVGKIWIILLVFSLALLSGGCGFTRGPVGNGQTEKPNLQGVLLEYAIVSDPEQLPVEVKGLIEEIKKQRGYYVFAPEEYATDGETYLLISAGAKPTGGYGLTVNSGMLVDGIPEIVLAEEEPAAGEGVIQVITFPCTVLQMSDGYADYRIVNSKNESFPAIPSADVPAILETEGIYVGQIDSNFIEIEVGGQAQAFMFWPEAVPLFAEELQTGDIVLFSYFENGNGQLVITALQLN